MLWMSVEDFWNKRYKSLRNIGEDYSNLVYIEAQFFFPLVKKRQNWASGGAKQNRGECDLQQGSGNDSR